MKTVEYLLTHTDELLQKKPFLRGSESYEVNDTYDGETSTTTNTFRVSAPRTEKRVVSQERFLKELDPECHEVMFDTNLPSICVKLQSGSFVELKFK